MGLFNNVRGDYEPPDDGGPEMPAIKAPNPAQDGSILGVLQALTKSKQALQEPSPMGGIADLLSKYLVG